MEEGELDLRTGEVVSLLLVRIFLIPFLLFFFLTIPNQIKPTEPRRISMVEGTKCFNRSNRCISSRICHSSLKIEGMRKVKKGRTFFCVNETISSFLFLFLFLFLSLSLSLSLIGPYEKLGHTNNFRIFCDVTAFTTRPKKKKKGKFLTEIPLMGCHSLIELEP